MADENNFAPVPPRKPYDYLSTLPILHGVDNDEIRALVRSGEGESPYMYPDTKGNITVGIGHHLPSIEYAQKLPFYYDDEKGKREASDKDIERAYNKLKKTQSGLNYTEYDPDVYSQYEKVKLEKQRIDRHYDDLLRQHARELRQKLPNFDTFEPEAQQALLDMQFNIGDRKFREQYEKNGKYVEAWPKLFEAIANRDWMRAAEESHRKDVQSSRNKAIKDLFLKAHQRKKKN